MKPLPPEVSLGQLLDIIHGKKPKAVPRVLRKKPLNKWWAIRPAVRHFSLKDPKAFEREWREFLAATPRDNRKFIERFKEAARLQEQLAPIQAKREKGKLKHLRRLKAQSSPTSKIPRSANHGSGGKSDTADARSGSELSLLWRIGMQKLDESRRLRASVRSASLRHHIHIKQPNARGFQAMKRCTR